MVCLCICVIVFCVVYVHPSMSFSRLPLPQHSTHFCFLATGTLVPTGYFVRICSQHHSAELSAR
ncbi:hypothetical protein LEMLEM_LOCUS7966 [Lemmus lemmus]